jgi:ADP-ribose pyrophosphatase YjhB (NUDIX family)
MKTEALDQEIQDRLRVLRSFKFDRLHLPGGTSLQKTPESHFCGAVIYRKVDSRYEVLAIPFNSRYHEDEKKTDVDIVESPEDTLAREMAEEVGVKLLEYQELERSRVVKDNHVKYFFMTDFGQCEGDIKKFEGANPQDPEIAAPIWLPVSYLAKKLFDSHKPALQEAMGMLATEDKDAMNELFAFSPSA